MSFSRVLPLLGECGFALRHGGDGVKCEGCRLSNDASKTWLPREVDFDCSTGFSCKIVSYLGSSK